MFPRMMVRHRGSPSKNANVCYILGPPYLWATHIPEDNNNLFNPADVLQERKNRLHLNLSDYFCSEFG